MSVVRKDVLEATDELVFPSTRAKVVAALDGAGVADAVGYEREAHLFAAGRIAVYTPLVQFLLEEGSDALPAGEAVAAFVAEANAPAGPFEDPEADCVRRIEAMKFECTVPGTTEGGRKCPKCGRGDLEAYGRQTRSADEGQTLFWRCSFEACGAEFR